MSKERFKLDLLVFVAGETHSVWRFETPMASRVAKVDLFDKEAHRKWSTLREVIILVANMHTLHIELHAVE